MKSFIAFNIIGLIVAMGGNSAVADTFATKVANEWDNLALSCSSYTVIKTKQIELTEFLENNQAEMNIAGMLTKSLNDQSQFIPIDFKPVQIDFLIMGSKEDEACEQAAEYLYRKFSHIRGISACNSEDKCQVIYFLQRKHYSKIELFILEAF